MGEGTPRVNGNGKAETRAPREIERDIEHLRSRLDKSLAELDRRRHELTDGPAADDSGTRACSSARERWWR